MKVTCIHTAAGPSVFGKIESEILSRTSVPCQISHMTDPDIIAQVSAAGHVTNEAARRLLNMYTAALNSGTDIILNMCSSVGEVAAAATAAVAMTGAQLIRVDERMCAVAAAGYKHIAMVGTLASTLSPSVRLLRSYAGKEARNVTVTEILADGAFGMDREHLTEHLCRAIEAAHAPVDALVFAQFSMWESAQAVSQHFSLPVLTSPGFAAEAVAEAVDVLLRTEKQQ